MSAVFAMLKEMTAAKDARIAELEAERDEMKRCVIETVRRELPDTPAAAERIIAALSGEGVTK